MPKLRSVMIGIALLFMVVATLMVVRGSPTKRGVELNFIRYAKDGPAVLNVTSHEGVPLRCSSRNAYLFLDVPPRAFMQTVVLMPRSHTQFLVAPYSSQEPRWPRARPMASLVCVPQSSKLRQRVEFVLGKAGVNIVSTGFVVSVDLPPK